MSEKIKIGFVGVGNISEIYLKNVTGLFKEIEVIGVCDLIRERAQKAKAEYNIPKIYDDMYQLFADPEVDIVLNITEAYNHYAVSKAALEAGKNVYSEKPLATTVEQGKELVALAKSKGLWLGGAPDTVLGAGIQTCRRLIDDGYIGKVFGGDIHMTCRGPESWHPDPYSFYQPGAGPLFDMGPYYMTTLINLLGRCDKIAGFSTKAHDERVVKNGDKYGEKIPVNIETFVTGSLKFDCGAVVRTLLSFDTYYSGAEYAGIVIFGTEGTLWVPDPNGFNGPIKMISAAEGWQIRELPALFPYRDGNYRALGLADMAKSMQTGRRHRCNYEQQIHVLEMMESHLAASREERVVTLTTPYTRPEPMDKNALEGYLD